MVSDTLPWTVTLIGDVVASRDVADRQALHNLLVAALTLANNVCEPVDPLTATVGDEFQATFADVFTALDATLLVRVALPIEYDVRFGVGVGPVMRFGTPGGGFPHQDGPAWWVARDAIEHVASTRRDGPDSLRTWLAAARAEDGTRRILSPVLFEQRAIVWALNAFLTTRDHLVSAMDARDRRIMRDLILGRAVQDIAAAEGVTSSAISQRIRRSGAAAVRSARDSLRSGLWSSVPPDQRRRSATRSEDSSLRYPSLEEVFAS